MKVYTTLFGVITYYMFGLFLLFGSLVLIGHHLIGLVKILGAFMLWVAIYKYLKSQKTYAFLVSFSVVSLFWFPLLHRTYERVIFINENGGFERADGYGSPLAFLMGMTFEQMFFIPLTILFIAGLVVMVSTMYNKDSETNL